IIMEMQVQNVKQWGITYYSAAGDNLIPRNGFASSETAPIKNLLDPLSDSGGVFSFGAGDMISITPPTGGTPIKIPTLSGFISFLSKITNTNILSTPQIMALDNEEATIEV